MVRERMRDRCGLVSANVGKPKWDLNKAHVAILVGPDPRNEQQQQQQQHKRMWFARIWSQNEISKIYAQQQVSTMFSLLSSSSLLYVLKTLLVFLFVGKSDCIHIEMPLLSLPNMSPTWREGLPKHRPKRLFESEGCLFWWICWRAMGTHFTQVINHAILSAVHQVGWVWMKIT